MFKSNSIFRKVSAFLVMVMVFMVASNSFVLSQELEYKSRVDSNTEIVTFDEGTIKYERITDDKLGETLKITNLDTNEEQLVFKDNNNIYLKNKNKEVLVVGNIVKDKSISNLNKSISNLSTCDNWTYFGPERIDFDLVDITALSVAAGIIAFGIGGPIAGVKAALATLGATSVYNGVYAFKWGRYRVCGTTVEGEYTSQLYQPNGNAFGAAINWSGKR